MQYEVNIIKGKGKSKEMGFPTLNFEIPEEFPYAHGIYAGSVVLEDKVYKAAIHYGPVPILNDTRETLEAHIIDEVLQTEPKKVWITLDYFLREIIDFQDKKDLIKQIAKDIERTKSL